jgi:iron-sulfur cluster assembly protein
MTETLTDIKSPVHLTPSAIAEIKRLFAAEENKTGRAMRIGVKGGGCSGMTYVLEFDNIEPDDVVHTFDGLEVIMKKSHELYLFGLTLDYSDGLNARGFEFKNPNAASTCGCGTSFSV